MRERDRRDQPAQNQRENLVCLDGMRIRLKAAGKQPQFGMAWAIARTIRRKMEIKLFSECVLGVFALDVAHEHVVQLLEGFYTALAATVVAMNAVVSQDF